MGRERRLQAIAFGENAVGGKAGEADDDFEELTDYLAQSPLTHLHVFPYSDRPGTVAASR